MSNPPYARTIEQIDDILNAPLPNLSEDLKSKLRSFRRTLSVAVNRSEAQDRNVCVVNGILLALDDEAISDFLING